MARQIGDNAGGPMIYLENVSKSYVAGVPALRDRKSVV